MNSDDADRLVSSGKPGIDYSTGPKQVFPPSQSAGTACIP